MNRVLLSLAVLAACCHGARTRGIEEETLMQITMKESVTTMTPFQSAGFCARTISICTDFGLVEENYNGDFYRNSTGLYFVNSDEEVLLSLSEWQYHKPVLIPTTSLWLIKTRRDDNTDRFHVFDTASLQWVNNNLDQIEGYKDWTTIHMGQNLYPKQVVTDTGLVLECEEGVDGAKFRVYLESPSGFETERFDQPPLRFLGDKLVIGIVNGNLRYMAESFPRAVGVPFTYDLSSFVSAEIVARQFPSIYVMAATFQRPDSTFTTRFIAFRIAYSSDRRTSEVLFANFQDRQGIIYPGYRTYGEMLRVVPTPNPSDDFNATMFTEQVEVSIRSMNLDMDLDVEVTQAQERQLRNFDVDSRGLHHSKCDDGECLAVFIGTSGKITIFYTNEKNLDFRWVRRGQSTVYEGGKELTGVQVSRESEGSWIVMAMVQDSSFLHFGRIKPVESPGVVWFDLPFDVRFEYSSCGLYASQPGQPSSVLCAKRDVETDFSGLFFEVIFGESDLVVTTPKNFVSEQMISRPTVKRVECVEPGTCAVVFERDTYSGTSIFQYGANNAIDGKLGPWLYLDSTVFGFEKKARKFFFKAPYFDVQNVDLDSREYRKVEVFPGGENYFEVCKVSVVSERIGVFVCKVGDDMLESFLLDSYTMDFRGLAFEPRDFDTCEYLSTERGTFVELCADPITRTLRSKTIKAQWDKLFASQMSSEEPVLDEPAIAQADSTNYKVAVIVLSSVLGVAFLGGIGFLLRKISTERAHVREETDGPVTDASVVVARPVL